MSIRMTGLIKAALFSLTVALSGAFSAHAATDDMLGYDAIVNELNRESERPLLSGKTAARRTSDPFESILFHGGVGMAALMQTVTFADGSQAFLGQRGIQAAFGIDLFSPYWIAEGTARTFGPSEDSSLKISLQEFELKVIHKNRFSSNMGYRAGAGLSARYMNIHHESEVQTFTTPSGVATLGLDFYVTDKMSFGADINGRSAMITETPDRNSVDATLRMDFHL